MTAKAAAREHLVWVTSTGVARDHAVIAETLAERSRANAEVIAQCGERFWPAPLIADPAPPCRHCVRHVRVRLAGERAGDRHCEGVVGRWLTAMVGTIPHLGGETDAVRADARKAHGVNSREKHS